VTPPWPEKLTESIQYFKGDYKYRLKRDCVVETSVFPEADVWSDYVRLRTDGLLWIKSGYCWDGASWAADSKTFLRASLCHDSLYQLIRRGLIPSSCRADADLTMHRICLDDGMSSIRAFYTCRGVRRFGGRAASKRKAKKLRTAP